jgi:hypothetical protein
VATPGSDEELRRWSEAQQAYLFLPRLLIVCNGRRPFLFLVEVCCGWCEANFCVCQRCWRGQVYCSDRCRESGRRRVHREAQRRYRKTPKGKKAHCQAENRRRHGWSKEKGKKMDDPSSRGWAGWAIGLLIYIHLVTVHVRAWVDRSGRCHFCGCKGRIVDRFPRRA